MQALMFMYVDSATIAIVSAAVGGIVVGLLMTIVWCVMEAAEK